MIKTILQMQKQRKFIIQGVLSFIGFMFIYILLDVLNGGYQAMRDEYGLWLVIGNILLNVIMASISALMMNMSTGLVQLAGKEGKGTFLTIGAAFFGMLTYGCTPCVISFFAVIGITFSVAVLPLAGLPYKLIALALLLLGGAWLIYEIQHVKCAISLPKDEKGQNT